MRETFTKYSNNDLKNNMNKKHLIAFALPFCLQKLGN